MILATESLALAASAAVTSYLAIRHLGRTVRRAETPARSIVAAAAFATALTQDAFDELYWGVARWLGMPDYLLYGLGPGLLKFADVLWIAPVIWLYTTKFRVAKAAGIPLVCYCLATAITWAAG